MAETRAAQQVIVAALVGFVAGVIGARAGAPAPSAAPGPHTDASLRSELEALAARLAEAPTAERVAELEAAVEILSAISPAEAPPAEVPVGGSDALTAQLIAAIDSENGEALLSTYDALLTQGLDPARRSAEGVPPLVVASGRGRAALVARMLEQADPDQRGERWGATSLVAASAAGDLAVVELLLGAGADPTAVCGPCDGPAPFVTALSLARDAGHEALSARLQEAVASWPGRRLIAAVVGHLVAAPGPGLEDEPMLIQLGRTEGSWGSYELSLGGEQVVTSEPFVLPARLGQQVFELEVHWRRAGQSGTQKLFVNKPNANEPVVTSVLELGAWPNSARVELLIDPINMN